MDQRAAGEVVEPGIPDVGPRGGGAVQAQRHRGGFHVLLPGLLLLLQDAGVGGLKPLQQLGLAGDRVQPLSAENVHGQAGGNLAAGMPAQAVGQGEDAAAAVQHRADAVLIVLPAALVGIGIGG